MPHFSIAWRLIIQDFLLFTAGLEQQDSLVSCSFSFIPLESVRSLKPLLKYNWNAHVVWGLAPSTNAPGQNNKHNLRHTTRLTSGAPSVRGAISNAILISSKPKLFFCYFDYAFIARVNYVCRLVAHLIVNIPALHNEYVAHNGALKIN